MTNMFERFTDRARRVMVLAQDEARLLQHNYLGTEHLLLGLIQEGQGVAALVLDASAINYKDVRGEIERIVGPGPEPTGGRPPFTPRSKKVVELAFREALQLGHNYISTEHLLLGLAREGEGVGAQILSRVTDLKAIKQSVLETLAGRPPLPLAPGAIQEQILKRFLSAEPRGGLLERTLDSLNVSWEVFLSRLEEVSRGETDRTEDDQASG